MAKLLTNKLVLIGLAIVALIGLIFISYNATQNTSSPTPSPTQTPEQPKVGTLPPPQKDHVVTGQIIVKFRPQYTDAQINQHLQQYNASIIKTIEGINQTVVKVPVGQEDAVMQKLQNDGYAETAQRDYTTHAFLVPNDPLFPQQYVYNNTGQSVGGKVGNPHADINIEAAWDVTQGNGVKVAILDTGINLNQPDLANKVALQKSFVSNTVEDGNGHGTHVAGIVSADTNNSVGVAGTCPGCQLLIGKVLDDSGSGTTSNATAGITWAADNGAKVISMSLGTTDPNTANLYSQAVNYAMGKGAVVVAAAGNDGNSLLNYPAAVTGVISVAATNSKDQKASYSNFGSYVQIAAPGDNILSTGPTHSFQLQPNGYSFSQPYYFLSGTSMATPVVAGVAALVASTPFGTTPQALTNRLYSTADKIPGSGTQWKSGRVDAALAVGTAPTATTPPQPTAITPTLFCVGGSGTPPCATIPPSAPTAAPTIATGNPTVAISGPASGGGQGAGGANPTGTPINGSPAPTAATNPGTPGGTGNGCPNIAAIFYNLNPNQSNTSAMAHHKHHNKGHKNGNGNGDANGFLSQFLQFLLKLLQQLLQLISQCKMQPGSGAPTPTLAPTQPPVPTVSTAPIVGATAAPTVNSPSPVTGTGVPSTSPATPTTPVTSSSCTTPKYTIPMNPNDAQAGVTIGNFYLTADTWNAANYQLTQTVYACDYNNWYAVANMNNNTGDGAVKTSPNVHEDVNKPLSSLHTITSTFAESGPHVGIYEFEYDLWLNGFGNGHTEIMIWNDNFGQTPSGSKQGTFTDGGQTYDVWRSGSDYIAFVAQNNFTSGTVNILNFFNYVVSKGWAASSSTVSQLDYGVELVSTNGTNQTFKVTNFSLTVN